MSFMPVIEIFDHIMLYVLVVPHLRTCLLLQGGHLCPYLTKESKYYCSEPLVLVLSSIVRSSSGVEMLAGSAIHPAGPGLSVRAQRSLHHGLLCLDTDSQRQEAALTR